jgi:hypothetical protein
MTDGAEEEWELINGDFEPISDDQGAGGSNLETPGERGDRPPIAQIAAVIAKMVDAVDQISAVLADGERECQKAALLTREAEFQLSLLSPDRNFTPDSQ